MQAPPRRLLGTELARSGVRQQILGCTHNSAMKGRGAVARSRLRWREGISFGIRSWPQALSRGSGPREGGVSCWESSSGMKRREGLLDFIVRVCKLSSESRFGKNSPFLARFIGLRAGFDGCRNGQARTGIPSLGRNLSASVGSTFDFPRWPSFTGHSLFPRAKVAWRGCGN